MVEQNIRLVYGGANVGIMGLLADTVLQLGGEAVGVISEADWLEALAEYEPHRDPSWDPFAAKYGLE